jgi:transcriptional regulator with XRE-family HTH domain
MTMTQPTALGKLLEQHRQLAGLSKSAAARRAGISRSTWDTLIRGYISRQGRHDPVTPKLENVSAAAAAVGANPAVAAKLAGYQLLEAPKIVHMNLSDVPTADLLAELEKRTDR